jgi:predicted metalloprotease with PDZ domain
MKNTKMYLTETEAKAAGLPSNQQQIDRYNAQVRYNKACEKAQVAYEVFALVKQSYHAGLTDDDTFLAARKVHETAKAEYDKAFAEASDILTSDTEGR